MGNDQKKFTRLFDKSGIESLQAIFDAVSDVGVVITDMENRIVVYNMAASFYDRMDQNTAIGMHYSRIYQDDDGGFIQKVIREGKPVLNQPARYHYADGRSMTSLDSIYPVYIDGQMAYVLSFTWYDVAAREALSKVFARHPKGGKKHRAGGSGEGGGTRFRFQQILGSSESLRKVISRAQRAAGSSAPVFLEGETGTGKEMFAQSIHSGSDRAEKPFVAVNCAAIPENLLESILFGTTKGSFTGAGDKAGLFEEAGEGTFFLDEINSMPLFLQAKLLRVIQEHRVRRIGAQQETEIHCRIIASCNQKVEKCFEEGSLRNDLFYRLSVIRLQIPPLRERKEDIADYLESFVRKFSDIYECGEVSWSHEFYEALNSYDWPGNVRELEHVVESAVVMMSEGSVLGLSDLPADIIAAYFGRSGETERRWDSGTEQITDPEARKETEKAEKTRQSGQSAEERREEAGAPEARVEEEGGEKPGTETERNIKNPLPAGRRDLRDILLEQEREMLLDKLGKNGWNISRTAKEAGMSRSSLQYRMHRLGIEKPKGK